MTQPAQPTRPGLEASAFADGHRRVTVAATITKESQGPTAEKNLYHFSWHKQQKSLISPIHGDLSNA